MLTEHDMRARYLFATLSAIQIDMQRGSLTAELQCSLALRVGGAAKAAAQLADDLGRARERNGVAAVSERPVHDAANVVPFDLQRRAR